MDVRGTPGTVPDSLRRFTRACSAFVSSATRTPGAPGMTRHRARIDVHEGVPAHGVAIYAAAGTARGRRIGRLTMTEPTGGPPSPQPPQSPPPQAPAPQPAGGSWGAPPPATAPGGFQTQAVRAEAGPAPGIAYAELVERIIALFIDAVIVGIIGFIVNVIVGIIGGGLVFLLLGGLVSAAISLTSFVYTWTTMRASPGQKILNLETVNSGDGSTMNQRQAVLRWLWLWGPQAIIGVIPFVALFAWPLEILYGLFLLYTTSQSPKRQGYHDVKSNTVVIKRVAA